MKVDDKTAIRNLRNALESLIDCVEADNPDAPAGDRTYRITGFIQDALEEAHTALVETEDDGEAVGPG